MNELVCLKRNNALTTSLIIAEGTGNQHESVVRILNKYPEDFGSLEFTDFKSGKRGRPTKVYYLNEEQAMLLITYLDNNEIVRTFKKNLVHQFVKMREFIVSKQSAEYLEARAAGKLVRKEETDTIKKLVEYAKEQGSGHADMLYVTYTRLANKIVGINKRAEASTIQLSNLTFIERAIWLTIEEGMKLGMYYKEIYKSCKAKMEQIKSLACLTTCMEG